MISGLDLNATVDYTLKKDTDNPTVWKLGIIPNYLFARLTTEAGTKTIETAYRVIQLGLKGWDNFNIEFKTEKERLVDRDIEVVPISILDRIPLLVITELAEKILEINQFTENERKN